jgi:mRNA-degrading endonuclease toxin of MazEF toxin-antitoxin module
VKRGDVVIVEFPYVDGRRGKNRPALIVQNDHDNARLTNTVIAMISGNTRHAAEATQLLVDPAAPEGSSSGLHGPSVVKCCNLYTITQADTARVIGSLSEAMMADVGQCLKAALDLK